MTSRAEKIVASISQLESVLIVNDIHENDHKVTFKVQVTESGTTLYFDVEILPLYPMQFHDTETIRFINRDLLEYDHVNHDGSVCVHTLHSTELTQKLQYDFESLRHWIRSYYIKQNADAHYEHIVVNDKLIDNTKSVFLFTDVDYEFTPKDCGSFLYSYLATGVSQKKPINTYLVQSFNIKKKSITCKWSKHYRNIEKKQGLFCFLEKPPVKNRRFVVGNWNELEPFVSQAFLQLLFSVRENISQTKELPTHIPILIGYPIDDMETHWQAAMLPTEAFPVSKHKVLKTHHYLGQFLNQEILWCQTRNSSYQYYYGRGMLHQLITQSKILVIGLGAIGSIVATSLVRGGVVDISIIDFDVKEPENVCRSEYDFYTGVCNKAAELHSKLEQISPFVQVRHSEVLMDVVKLLSNTENAYKRFDEVFGEYDIIFDCTTDNDIANILDRISTDTQVYCLSVTNEAKELVCAVKPNLYAWLSNIFDRLKTGASQDLYEPTGCWSPTFKAGYTDIATLVQWAIKQIDMFYLKNLTPRNFVITTQESNNYFEPKLLQF